MCGIVAVLSQEAPVSRSSLRSAVETLHHRGPDASRTWISEDGKVGLGHARLSIIDLSTGDQPIASESESVRIVANGEFYDFERQRQELTRRGHRFRTRSDSEIALHLYEDFGAHCLTHLRGEFAFIIWDADNRLLFAARDRFGIKPLFYAVHDGALHLASEAKALFAAGVPAGWDAEAVYQASLGPPLLNRTFFAGVHQVPPGHYLLATPHHLEIHRYWDFDYPVAGDLDTTRDETEYVNEYRRLLEESVRLRLRADVPVGCYLSGGVDSAAVLGLAARHAAEPVRAFTLSFDEEGYDESRQAEEMAAQAGAVFEPVPISQADLADHFADAIWHAETLFVNGHGIAKFLLSRAVREAGYKVVLTGEGADEVLAGYPHFRRDLARSTDESNQLLAELDEANRVSAGMLLPAGDSLRMDSTLRLLGFVPAWIEALSTGGAKRLPLLSRQFQAEFADRDVIQFFLNTVDLPGQVLGREPLSQSLYLNAKCILPNYILSVLGDRMEMAHSVEGRLPFLDHRAVEMLRTVPSSLKIHGMTEKYLLRRATEDVLTDTIFNRQKHPFLAPPMTLRTKEPLAQLLQDTLRGSSLAALPFYDQQQVVGVLDRLPDMSPAELVPWDTVLMTLLSFCVLQEQFRL